MWHFKLIRLVVDSLVLLICGAMIAGWLLRIAPGAAVDEREADHRFSAETIARLKAHRDAERAGAARSLSWFMAAVRGDLGRSDTTGEPVSAALAERTPLTVKTVISGATGGFTAGVIAAAASTFASSPAVRIATTGASLGVLAVPSGLLALFAVFLRLPVELAVAVVVAPRTCLYAIELFAARAQSAWMLSARAAGVPARRVFLRHLLPSVSGELGALAGLAVITALAVTIPAEVLTGRPGLGQLAWQSAMERDMPVVIAVTLVMIVIARSVTLLSAQPDRRGGAAV
jgi:ABC-type dipeptide/oligopeptide/nickel transport system permease component